MPNNNPLAAIFGCSGKALTKEEKSFFQKHNPLGFILFARNIETPEQVKALVDDMKSCVSHKNVPILIDQEGGRVQRLKSPYWRDAPPASDFGDILETKSIELAKMVTKLNAQLIASELLSLGINVDCAPVLDVPIEGAHDVIGNRAFSKDAKINAVLGKSAHDGFLSCGVIPIVKHIPGHGRSFADSHENLPVVEASLQELEKTDFIPFKENNNALWAMTAHIVYTAIDDKLPATMSPTIINEIIRKKIGFNGFLVSDDLSMKALSGTFEERTKSSLEAGCDAVLHCNGKMEEMIQVANAAKELDKNGVKRLEKSFEAIKNQKQPFNFAEKHKEFETLIA